MLLLLTFIPIFGASSRTNAQKKEPVKQQSSSKTQQQVQVKKYLVAYFSHTNNTAGVAAKIKEITGADIFRIQPVKPYPSDYTECTRQAKREIEANYKPELKTKPENLNDYDVIFIGSPCWWSTFAPPVATFLSSYNFSGKTIVPFMTHEGSRMGRTEADIKKLCPNSTVLEGLPIRGSDVRKNETKEQIINWLRKLKLIR